MALRTSNRRGGVAGGLVLVTWLCLGAGAAAAESWELRRPNVTVIVEGDRTLADRVLQRILLLQATVRQLVSWPGDFQPRSVSVFVPTEALAREVFGRPDGGDPTALEARVLRGQMLNTGALTVIAVPIRADNGHELDALQRLYGYALLAEAPTVAWPDCARTGLANMVAAAEFKGTTHLKIPALHIAGTPPLDPDRFLSVGADEVDPALRERRAFSCYLLDQMYVTGPKEQREAIAQLYTALGTGARLGTAITAPLGGSLAAFTMRFRDFAKGDPFRGHELDIVAELPAPDARVASAAPVEAPRLHGMLEQLCAKLGVCAVVPAPAAPATSQ